MRGIRNFCLDVLCNLGDRFRSLLNEFDDPQPNWIT